MATITLKLTGFDEMIEKITKAGMNAEPIINDVMVESAKIQGDELAKAMAGSGVASDLIARMPAPKVEWDHGLCRARVGYDKGAYDPRHIDDAYKAIFINYGTPRIKPRNFVDKAKKAAKPKITKLQKEAFEQIMGEIER